MSLYPSKTEQELRNKMVKLQADLAEAQQTIAALTEKNQWLHDELALAKAIAIPRNKGRKRG